MPNFSPLTLCISATSFAISQFLFHVGSCRLSTRFTCGFTKLNAKQKIEWNSRTVSTIHAAVVGCFCLYILVYDDAVNKDPVWGNPFMVKLNVAITSGYLISGKWSRDDMDKPLRGHSCCLYNFRDYLPQYHWNPMNHTVAKGLCWAFLVLILWQIQHKLLLSSYDINDGNEEYGCEQSRICAIKCHGTADEDLLLIICYWKAIGDKYFVTHHVAALYAYYYVLGEGMLPYFGNFRLLAEFSTPFVNQRWFFEVLGYPKHSLPNMVNGVLMTVVFFIVRIAVIPTYYTRVFSTFGTEAFHRLGLGAQCAWIISSVSLDIMNVMWMMKITKGCYKVLYHTDGVLTKTQKNGKAE